MPNILNMLTPDEPVILTPEEMRFIFILSSVINHYEANDNDSEEVLNQCTFWAIEQYLTLRAANGSIPGIREFGAPKADHTWSTEQLPDGSHKVWKRY